MKYFYIIDRSDQAFDAVVPRGQGILRPGACTSCGFVPIGLAPASPLVVRRPRGRSRPVFTHTNWGFCVAHIDLLRSMGEDAAAHLLVGSVILDDGTVVDEYKTVRAKEQVLMRDGPSSVHRVCGACGAIRYTGWPGVDPYIMAWNLRSHAPVYEVEAESLLLREDLREKIGSAWSQLIGFRETRVLDVPRDELPAQLDVIPTHDQLVGYRPNASTKTTPSTP